MNEFEFKWEVLGMGYEMSQCKCDTVACMVFVTEGLDTTITTVFTKDNLSLKKSVITQQTIVLTENKETLYDPKKLKPMERPVKREIEDIFDDTLFLLNELEKETFALDWTEKEKLEQGVEDTMTA